MTKQSKTTSASLTGVASSEMEEGAQITDRVEFHRNAVALISKIQDANHDVAVMLLPEKTALSYRGCSCSEFKTKTCRHIKELSHMVKAYRRGQPTVGLFDNFRNSVWYHLAELLWDADRTPCESIRIIDVFAGEAQHLEVVDQQNQMLISYYSGAADKSRFIDRLSNNSGKPYATRSDILKRLKLLTLSEDERKLMDIGMKTRRQAMEDSFWYRMAYHAFKELGAGGFSLDHEINEVSGQFRISVVDADQAMPFRLIVPKHVVSRLSPVYVYQPKDGRQRQFTYKQAKKFSFGTLFHIPQTDMVAPIAPPDALFKVYGEHPQTTIRKGKVPDFLKTYGELIRNGACLLGDSAKELQVFNTPRYVALSPSALERDWCWLSVTYGFGKCSRSSHQPHYRRPTP